VGSPKKVTKHGLPKGRWPGCALGYAHIKASCHGLNSKERHSRALTLPLSFPPHPAARNRQETSKCLGPKKKWPLPMWSSRFSGKDMDEYLSEARNACHANELKFITYKTARQRSMNTCAGPATPVEKQVVFVFVYQIDWLIMVDNG